MKLNKIALVKTGLLLSRKQSKTKDNGYEYRQLNLKSVVDNGTINMEETMLFYASKELEINYLTQIGDVIVKTSEPYTAVYVIEEYAGLVVPSHFVIIRVDKSIAIPQYIAWYLNRDHIKRNFRMSCSGLLMQIKPSTIAETEIKLPSLERQKQVVEIYETAQQEIRLYEKLIQIKKVYYKTLINRINKM